MVEWVDSAFAQGWMDRDAVGQHAVSEIVSCGLLVNENKAHITIMQSASLDKNQYGDGLTIPRCCITRMRTLGVKTG